MSGAGWFLLRAVGKGSENISHLSSWLEVTIGRSPSIVACCEDLAVIRFRQASQTAKIVSQLHSISESSEPNQPVFAPDDPAE